MTDAEKEKEDREKREKAEERKLKKELQAKNKLLK